MSWAYYNEIDDNAADWLENLIDAGEIAPGEVDRRSIVDVKAGELRGYTQHHFFAGIGGWSYALRLAGWPDARPVWTGSCPCQPFSNAGKRRGTADERHLWPEFRRLIAECAPATVLGEQVASKAGREWLAGVRTDLEALDYAVGAADLCAAGVGAPHIRQRLYWLADNNSTGYAVLQRGSIRELPSNGAVCGSQLGFECSSTTSGLADADGGLARDGDVQRGGQHGQQPQDDGAGGLGDAQCAEGARQRPLGLSMEPQQDAERPDYANAWAEWRPVECADGKARRFEPGSFPLAHGVPGRVGRLRGYGNAIVPQVAAAFIQAAFGS